MKEYILDFTGLTSRREVHDYLQQAFQLPGYYGRNLDALWDCLYGCFDGPAEIVLRNIQALPEAVAPGLLALFEDLQHQDPAVTLRLEGPEQITGPV